jgi:chemotaxis protein MotB
MPTPHLSSVRHSSHSLAIAAALATAILVPSAACVSSGQYKSLQDERDAIANRNQDLQTQVNAANQKGEALQQEKTALEQQKAAVESEKAALAGQLARLEEQGKALGSQLQQNEQEAKQQKSTYDGLLTSLKKELEAGQIKVQQMRDGLRVDVAQEILFASGSAGLDKSGMEVLQRVAEQLKQTNYQIVVTGHTDNKPIGAGLVARYPTNWELAGARAASVVRLFSGSGIPAPRLLAVSMADTRPVASNETPEGRAKNRRIEIRMRPVVVDETK